MGKCLVCEFFYYNKNEKNITGKVYKDKHTYKITIDISTLVKTF